MKKTNPNENPYYKELLSLIKLLEFEVFQTEETITYKKFLKWGWTSLEFHILDDGLYEHEFFLDSFNYEKNKKFVKQFDLNEESLIQFKKFFKKEIRQKRINKLLP